MGGGRGVEGRGGEGKGGEGRGGEGRGGEGSTSVRNLGVVFDSRLNTEEQVAQTAKS